MGVIVLRRVEQQEGETDSQFVYRVLAGFAKGAAQSADAAIGEGHAEIYKRGKADGMADCLALVYAVLEELQARAVDAAGKPGFTN